MAADTGKTPHPWLKYCQIRDALVCLSDRDLADIGVKRGDIPTIASRGAGFPVKTGGAQGYSSSARVSDRI